MNTVELRTYFYPDDKEFRGDRVRSEIYFNNKLMRILYPDYGDSNTDEFFEGYRNAIQHIYGDGKVKVLFNNICCESWDDVEKVYDTMI